jgi:hypothetical protein
VRHASASPVCSGLHCTCATVRADAQLPSSAPHAIGMYAFRGFFILPNAVVTARIYTGIVAIASCR